MRRHRADLGAALLVSGWALPAGLLVGVAWFLLAPQPQVIASGGRLYPVNPEGKEFVAADGWFAVLACVTGVLAAAVVYARHREQGIGAVCGLAGGGLLGAATAWALGAALSPALGPVAALPQEVAVTVAAQIRAPGVLLLWPMAAVTVFLALAAGAEPTDDHDPVACPGSAGPR